MTVAAEELSQYNGQRVVVVYTPSGSEESLEVEGSAEAASEIGVLLKPKGRQNVELIEATQIEDIRFAPEKAKKLAQQEVLNLKYGSARKHILDRHGIALSEVNDLSEESALEWHNGVDHADLGHVHVAEKTKKKAKAQEGDSEESTEDA